MSDVNPVQDSVYTLEDCYYDFIMIMHGMLMQLCLWCVCVCVTMITRGPVRTVCYLRTFHSDRKRITLIVCRDGKVDLNTTIIALTGSSYGNNQNISCKFEIEYSRNAYK